MKLEQENKRLSLRKNKINNILYSKRKITCCIDNEFQKEYVINQDDFHIPEEFKINITKFYQNVSIIIHFILCFILIV